MTLNIHTISPAKVIKGEQAWVKSNEIIANISKNPLIVGRSISTKNIRDSFKKDLLKAGIQPLTIELN